MDRFTKFLAEYELWFYKYQPYIDLAIFVLLLINLFS